MGRSGTRPRALKKSGTCPAGFVRLHPTSTLRNTGTFAAFAVFTDCHVQQCTAKKGDTTVASKDYSTHIQTSNVALDVFMF
jgi:hypothetical protein